MNYRWEGGETLDGIVRVVECGGDSRKWPPFSPTQLRYFVLERSLSTEARFVSSFTLGETGFEASVLLRSHAMREHAVDYSARFCCQLLVSIPGTFLYIYITHIYMYIHILRHSPRQKLCQPFQRILPTISSLYIAAVPNFYDIACNRPWCNLYPSCCNGLLDFLDIFRCIVFPFFPFFLLP